VRPECCVTGCTASEHDDNSNNKNGVLFLDDCRIMTFLRGCNFSLEKTKRKLDMYFTMRAAIPEFFADRDITRPELQEILKLM
jgi:hypothetical protein